MTLAIFWLGLSVVAFVVVTLARFLKKRAYICPKKGDGKKQPLQPTQSSMKSSKLHREDSAMHISGQDPQLGWSIKAVSSGHAQTILEIGGGGMYYYW
jgi:hypothetical protein